MKTRLQVPTTLGQLELPILSPVRVTESVTISERVWTLVYDISERRVREVRGPKTEEDWLHVVNILFNNHYDVVLTMAEGDEQ